ncbi:MAG: HD-GYP domain-containing protein [Alphaproteobacteria bacterium]
MQKQQKEELNKLFSSLETVVSEEEKLIVKKLLARFQGFSDWSKDHFERVGCMAEAFAKHLGASENAAKNLGLAATLHDVGKINIPKEIINTKVPLGKEAFDKFFKPHAADSIKILEKEFANKNTAFAKVVIAMSADHHEKCNGSGYPLGKKEQDISIEGQIASLCDVFDAMNYSRPYQKGHSQGDILCRMIDPENTNFTGAFNSDLLNKFVAFRISEYEKDKSKEDFPERLKMSEEERTKIGKYIADSIKKAISHSTVLEVALAKRVR